MKSFSVALLTGLLITNSSFAAPIANLISEWNAMHANSNQVFDPISNNTGTLNNVNAYWDNNGLVFSFANNSHITVPDSLSLHPTSQLTVLTWMRANAAANGTQTLLSQFQRNTAMTMSDLNGYDAINTGGVNSAMGQYMRPTFDGRYIYTVSMPPNGSISTLLRYDTTLGLNNPNAWSNFVLYTLRVNDSHWYSGYRGGVFDGRYLYLIPYYAQYEPGAYHGFTLRYDTKAPLNVATSWKSMDIRALDGMNDLVGFSGGLFDGKYVYFCGGGRRVIGQKVARYDISLPFDNAAAWSYVTISNILPSVISATFYAMVQKDNYLYFISNNNGMFVRYDNRKALSDPTAWTSFNAINVGGTGKSFNYTSGTTDGRYLYFSPGVNYAESMLRYDTTMPFENAAAWTTYSVATPNVVYSYTQKSFGGVGFDGKYVYYFPYNYKEVIPPVIRTRFGGNIYRYDTSQSFTDASAWTTLNMSSDYGNYNGVAFNQRYFYATGASNTNHPYLFQLDTASNNNYGFALNRVSYLNDDGAFGPNFSIATVNGFYSVYANTMMADGWHLVAGVYDGSAVSLYIDANLIGSQPASGALIPSPANLLIGSSFNGANGYVGDLNKAQLYGRALTQSELQSVYYASPYGGCGAGKVGLQCR